MKLIDVPPTRLSVGLKKYSAPTPAFSATCCCTPKLDENVVADKTLFIKVEVLPDRDA